MDFSFFMEGKQRILMYMVLSALLTMVCVTNVIQYGKQMEYTQSIENTRSVPGFVLEILVATVILILVFKFMHIKLIALIFELFMVLFPAVLFFTALLLPLLHEDVELLIGIGFGLATILFIAKQLKQGLKDWVTIISATGIASAMFLNFSPDAIIGISLLLLVYDFVAVFITKHMVFFAKNIIAYNLPLTVTTYVDAPKGEVRAEGKEEAGEHKKEEQKEKDSLAEVKKATARPGKSRMDLGSGDIIMFSVLTVVNSLMFGVVGLILSLVVGLAGVQLMLDFVMKKKMVFPALVVIIPVMVGLNVLLRVVLFVAAGV